MTLERFINELGLNNSVLLGYYGGGNFGDELLLAILLYIAKNEKNVNISYYYTNRSLHAKLHTHTSHNAVFSLPRVLFEMLRRNSIVVGGGGHWGLDMNSRVFLMTVLLFFFHFIFRKQVYLLGVGFYDSTTRQGRLSAYLAAKSCTEIIARDKESFRNFSKYTTRVTQGEDIAFQLKKIELTDYRNESKRIAADMNGRM